MKILQLCNKSPWPPKEGGSIAMNAITESIIHEGHQVKVLAMNTNKYAVDEEKIPREYIDNTSICFADVDLRIDPWAAFCYLFNKKSYIVNRFNQKNFRTLLRETLTKGSFDIVQLETLYLTPYIPDIRKLSNAKVVLRSHNIEHKIWKRYSANIQNPLKKIYVHKLSKELEQYEKEQLNNYDGILTISKVDQEFYKKHHFKGLVACHPFSINLSRQSIKATKRSARHLFHLGSMDWKPNLEGISWFLNNVWGEIHQAFPSLEFHLAGRNMPKWIYKASIPGLIVDGEVIDAHHYMQSKQIMIVPLFSGSGIRIKIIEGMLNSNLVITTTTGAEGINAINGKHFIIADSKQDFINAIEWVQNHPEESKKIGKQAREFIHYQHNLRNNASDLITFYQRLIKT